MADDTKPVAPVAPADPAADLASLLVEALPHLGHTIAAAGLKERIHAFIAAQSDTSKTQ
jgi:hypothetical protein